MAYFYVLVKIAYCGKNERSVHTLTLLLHQHQQRNAVHLRQVKCRTLRIPFIRLPHQEPLAADRQESAEPEHQPDEHTHESMGFVLCKIAGAGLPVFPKPPGSGQAKPPAQALDPDYDPVQQMNEVGICNTPPSVVLRIRVRHARHFFHKGEIDIVVGHIGKKNQQGVASQHKNQHGLSRPDDRWIGHSITLCLEMYFRYLTISTNSSSFKSVTGGILLLMRKAVEFLANAMILASLQYSVMFLG